MPATLTAVRTALSTALAAIPGLNTSPTAPGQVTIPMAFVMPGEPVVSFDSTMARGSDDFQFIVRLLVGNQTDYASQGEIDKYLAGTGTHSVKEAVDGNLGGAVDFSRVATARNYGEFDHNGVIYLGVEFVVEVTA